MPAAQASRAASGRPSSLQLLTANTLATVGLVILVFIRQQCKATIRHANKRNERLKKDLG